ncbi:aspartate aminotransferase family protein, partial [Staphylococcus aureus]|nr:aspartate aminotransferase family protein [Staphylococcus aureus]
MDHIAPLGNIYQAGTLSGNPLAMTSGYETLSQLTPETYEYFNMLGDILEDGLKRVFAKHNVPITVNRAGSMIGYFLNEGPVTNFEQANKSDLKLFAEMYREMAKE